MKNQAEMLSQYLNKNFEYLEMDGSSGTSNLNFPNFDLSPHDYLDFAGKDSSHTSQVNRINTVSNLKRALECELDTLLHVLGLHDKKQYANNVPKKLDFMDNLGLISPRSFKKLNIIRNKIEHDYYVPNENEIDTFYDLTFALISSIEWFLLSFSMYQSINFSSDTDVLVKKDKLYFTVEYNLDEPYIEFNFSMNSKEERLSFDSNNYDAFVFAFSTYILLIKSSAIFDKIRVLKEFNMLYQTFMEKANKA